MSLTAVYDPSKVMANARKQAERGMTRACMHVRNEVVKSINVGQPVMRSGNRLIGLDPSEPGDPPHVLYGRLKQSIAFDVEVRDDEVVGRIGTNVKYARALELGYAPRRLAPRPYLRPGVVNNREEILRRFVKG